MSLRPLLGLLERGALAPVVEASTGGALSGIEAMRAPVVASLASQHERPLLVITATRREAEAVRDDLSAWLPGRGCSSCRPGRRCRTSG